MGRQDQSSSVSSSGSRPKVLPLSVSRSLLEEEHGKFRGLALVFVGVGNPAAVRGAHQLHFSVVGKSAHLKLDDLSGRAKVVVVNKVSRQHGMRPGANLHSKVVVAGSNIDPLVAFGAPDATARRLTAPDNVL